ncbi:MAG: TGS domain-containing protein, partial [Muribaculaceae bacterium]|nr:TGS domain-containing protein [Muribaculaceae bacterium]
MITITFPNKDTKQFKSGVTPLEIANSISPRLAQDVLAASVNGQEWDLTRPISEDATLTLYKMSLIHK